jgi:hypothetical protein
LDYQRTTTAGFAKPGQTQFCQAKASQGRTGAALILALVILTMLLALALPFVFTQGAASNGARAWHQHTAADRGAASARNLALGLGGSGLAQTYNDGYTILNVGINDALELPAGADKVATKLSQDRAEVINLDLSKLPLGLNRPRFRTVSGTDVAGADGDISSTWDYAGRYPAPNHAYTPLILPHPNATSPAPSADHRKLVAEIGTQQALRWRLSIDRGDRITNDRQAIQATLTAPDGSSQQLTAQVLHEGVTLPHPGLEPGALRLQPPMSGQVAAGDAWTVITGWRPSAPSLRPIADPSIHIVAVVRGGDCVAAEAHLRPVLELRSIEGRALHRNVAVNPGGSFSWEGGSSNLSFVSGQAQIVAHGDQWRRVKNKGKGTRGSQGLDRYLAEAGRTSLGVTLTDESTRLDINHMTPEIWSRLLKLVGCEEARHRHRGRMNLPRFLCFYPNRLPERAYTSVDQLLEAGLREHELFRVLPYITVHGTSPGRGEHFGVVDIGTVLEVDGGNQRPIIDLDNYSGWGEDQGEGHRLAQRNSRLVFWGANDDQPQGFMLSHPDRFLPVDRHNVPQPGVGDAIAVVAAQRLNIHHLPRRIGHDLLQMDIELLPEQYFTGIDSLLKFPAKKAKSLNYGQYDGTALALADPLGRRQAWPVIGLRSSGLFRVHAAATSSDIRNRPVSSQGQTLIAQLLPKDKPLSTRWRSQSDWLGLELERFTSRITTWPRPLQRRQNPTVVPDPDPTTGAITAQMNGSSTSGPHIRPNWRARGQADGEDVSISELLNNPSVSTGLSKQSIRPDGIVMQADNQLAWDVNQSKSPIKQGNAGEMAPVTIGFWVSPQENWNDSLGEKEITLFDMRPAHRHTGDQIDGTQGNNDFQNNLRLWFDTANEHLVLSMHGPTIERTTDRVSSFTDDPTLAVAADDPTTVRWDECSLGSLATTDRQALAPEQAIAGQHLRYVLDGGMERGAWYRVEVIIAGPGPGQQAILVNGFTGRNAALLEPGEPVRTGDYALVPQLTLVTSLPERQLGSEDYNLHFPSIEVRGNPILDAIASRAGESAASYSLPASGVIRIGSEYISYGSIQGNTLMNCYRGRRVSAHPTWQPPSDEQLEERPYLSTQDFPEIRTPISEAHEEGDLVLPGDFRRAPGTNTKMFIGQNYLGADFRNGDPNEARADGSSNPFQWYHWGRLSTDANDYPSSHKEVDEDDPEDIDLFIDENTTEIVCSDGWVEPSVWPSRGIIRVNRDHYFHYSQFDGKRFSNLTHIPRQMVFRVYRDDDRNIRERVDNSDTWLSLRRMRFNAARPGNDGSIRHIYLVSMELQNNDGLFDIEAFRPDPYSDNYEDNVGGNNDDDGDEDGEEEEASDANQGDGEGYRVLQLEDAATGRIEWISYNAVHTDLGIPYVVNRSGFGPRQRGLGRTIFMGPYGQPDTNWQAGARILPVQTSFGGGHWLETGDVVTLMPTRNNRRKPQQNIVRFVSKDSFGTNHEDSYNANDDWFTFVEPVRETRFNWEILQGRGWSGPDMSVYWPGMLRGHNRRYRRNGPLGPYRRPSDPANGIMPRVDMMHEDGSPGHFFIGRRDPRRASASDRDHPTFAVIDDFYAQQRDIHAQQLGSINNQPSADPNNPNHEDWRGELDLNAAMLVAHDRNWPGRNDRRAFLIGGELVAYDVRNQQILMHNGFGSAPAHGQRITAIKRLPRRLSYTTESIGNGRTVQHYDAIAGQPRGVWQQGPTILPLPLGPIQILSDGIPAGIEAVSLGNPYQHAPAHIALSEDGSTATVVSLIRSHRNVNGAPEPWTAPWLQGLYHTERVDPGTGILIGMWPRYAPALPDRDSTSWTSLTEEDKQAALRSRMFPWVSLVSDAYQSTFDRVRVTGAPPPADGGVYSRPDFFSIELRALAEGAKWRTAAGAYGDGGAQVNGHMVSLDNRYSRPQNGAEVRVHFRYLGGEANPVIQPDDPELPYKAMFMGGMTTAIGSASLRFSSEGGVLHNVAAE